MESSRTIPREIPKCRAVIIESPLPIYMPFVKAGFVAVLLLVLWYCFFGCVSWLSALPYHLIYIEL